MSSRAAGTTPAVPRSGALPDPPPHCHRGSSHAPAEPDRSASSTAAGPPADSPASSAVAPATGLPAGAAAATACSPRTAPAGPAAALPLLDGRPHTARSTLSSARQSTSHPRRCDASTAPAHALAAPVATTNLGSADCCPDQSASATPPGSPASLVSPAPALLCTPAH